MNEAALNKYASRKFTLTASVILLATVLSIFGYLTPLLVEIFKWTCGLYCGFNVTQKGMDWVTEKAGGST